MNACGACGTTAAPDARFCSFCGARLGGSVIEPDVRDVVMTALRAEHRLVTVVFADMAGSVRQTRDLDAEQATALVNPLLETMVELMVRHGGRIDRFLGDGILAVFGVPGAHEDDPIRAVRAGLELRERATELGLGVTVGVNTGRVYFGPVGSSLHEELTVMGPTVNLAARLQGAASTGEVLVGGSTAGHVSAAFALTPRDVVIKGLDQPVTAHVVERQLDHPDKVRGIEGLSSPMIGREATLAALVDAVEGGGRAVAIVAEAGLGKSRLATELRRSLDGVRWLGGNCVELTRDAAFAGLVDVLRRHLGDMADEPDGVLRWVGLVDPDDRRSLVRNAPFLVHALGLTFGDSRDEPVVAADGVQRRQLSLEAVTGAVAAAAGPGPAVLFVDDVHWADELTIAGLERLATRADTEVTIVVASRPDDTRRLLQELLSVSGLSGDVEAGLVAWAQGNPFYVEELIRSLLQRGLVVRAGERWVGGDASVHLEIPESVEALVMSRFDRLAPDPRRAGQVAAVLGRQFTDAQFRAIAGDVLATSLAVLEAGGFVTTTDDEHRFTHALTREAVYASLLPSQRSELHGHVGDALGRLDPDDHEVLAHHYERSPDHLAAVTHLVAAGRRAADRYSNEVALSHLDRALERVDILTDGADMWRARCLLESARVRERLGDYETALKQLETAEAIVDDDLDAASIRQVVGRIHQLEGRFGDAHAAFDRAAAALGDRSDDDAGRAWIDIQVDRARALYFGGRGRELPALIDEVQPRVDRFGTRTQHADVLMFRSLHAFIAEHFRLSTATVEIAREAIEMSEAGADPGRIADARFRLGFSLLWADEPTEAADHLGRAVAMARQAGDVMLETRAVAYLAIAHRRSGEVEAALTAAETSFEIADRMGSPYYRGHSLAVSGWARWRLGDPPSGEVALLAAVEAWGPADGGDTAGADVEFAWLAAWPLAAIASGRGDLVSAVEHLQLVTVPWERTMAKDLEDAVRGAIRNPDTTSLGLALRLAERDRLV